MAFLEFAPVASEVTDDFAQGVLSSDLWLRFFNPAFQLCKYRQAVFLTTGFTVSVAAGLRVALDAIQLVDQVKRDVGTSRLAFGLHFCASTTCVEHAPSSLNALCHPVRPTRCNRRNHRPTRSRYPAAHPHVSTPT